MRTRVPVLNALLEPILRKVQKVSLNVSDALQDLVLIKAPKSAISVQQAPMKTTESLALYVPKKPLLSQESQVPLDALHAPQDLLLMMKAPKNAGSVQQAPMKSTDLSAFHAPKEPLLSQESQVALDAPHAPQDIMLVLKAPKNANSAALVPTKRTEPDAIIVPLEPTLLQEHQEHLDVLNALQDIMPLI